MNSRREFLKKSGAGLLLTSGTSLAYGKTYMLESQKSVAAIDKIRIGLIGAGIIGHYDTDTALKVPGVELVAVCDLYQGRLDFAKEKWGNSIFITRDYREVLARTDIDAVLICTPDHWHDHISIAALKAGKHVYCEKPMVHHIEEGLAVVEAHRKSGKVFQVGSQRASSAAILKARDYYNEGIIGDLNYVETFVDRSDSSGAWNYSIPTDASPETVDWDRYLGDAPKAPFDAKHFFRWRNYKQYGTGVSGDLFVHLLTAIHTVTGSFGPTSIYALGDISYWKDGRNANDNVSSVMRYPIGDTHPSFQFFTRVNLASGAGDGSKVRLFGTEGMIDIAWNDFEITHFKRPKAPGFGGYDSYESFSAKQKEEFKKWYAATYKKEDEKWTNAEPIKFKSAENYDDREDHFIVFFNAIRGKGKVIEDAAFGLRAAAPSLAANLSAERNEIIKWDPIRMKMI
jgi:predicted dehydrogenase